MCIRDRYNCGVAHLQLGRAAEAQANFREFLANTNKRQRQWKDLRPQVERWCQQPAAAAKPAAPTPKPEPPPPPQPAAATLEPPSKPEPPRVRVAFLPPPPLAPSPATGALVDYFPVSYTHLDVYKRQE